MRLFGVDDHRPELEDVERVARRHNIKSHISETVKGFGKFVSQISEDDIIVADNNIEGVNSLSDLRRKDIDTSSGTQAGLKLLTEYCNSEDIKPGMKILLTQWKVSADSRNYVARRVAAGERIYIFKKRDDRDMANMETIISNFYRERLANFVSDKVKYVFAFISDWDLRDDEVARLFGVSDKNDQMWNAIQSGNTTSRDVEARCDLLYRLKATLALAYGGGSPKLEAEWLHKGNPVLNGRSPLEFVGEGYQHRLAEMVLRIEGPW